MQQDDERDDATVAKQRWTRERKPRRETAQQGQSAREERLPAHPGDARGAVVLSAGPAATVSVSLAARQERALALACQGMRPAAIAEALGVSPTTVRRWLRKRFDGIAQEVREEYTLALLRAVESQREIVRAAWEAYHHEREVESALLRGELDYVRRRAVRRGDAAKGGGSRRSHAGNATADDAAGSDEELASAAGQELLLEEFERPRHSSQGARYLAVALAAQREMSRLQGLYDEIAPPPAQVSITITRRPDGPENIPPPRHAALPAPSRNDMHESDDEERADDDEGNVV